MQLTIESASKASSAECSLQDLATRLTVPPEPFVTYAEAVQIRSLLFYERNVAEPGVAGGESDFVLNVFGSDRTPTRPVHGVASLPLGTPVEVQLIFEIRGRRR